MSQARKEMNQRPRPECEVVDGRELCGELLMRQPVRPRGVKARIRARARAMVRTRVTLGLGLEVRSAKTHDELEQGSDKISRYL